MALRNVDGATRLAPVKIVEAKSPAEEIPLVGVLSSNLAAVGYDAARRVLRVRFNGGKVWDYAEVSELLHQQLLAAPSIGSFFAREIKPHHVATEVPL